MAAVGNETATVTVELAARSYSIEIGGGLLARLGARLRRLSPAKRVTLVTESTVGPLYADAAQAALDAAGFGVTTATVPAGEATKCLDAAGRLYETLAAAPHGRGDPIIALGGGVVGDLAGFVAATWMRGVPFVQCPTTLEADIDASVGGKTAVNHPAGKNLIGAFHQPVLVCIDTACLATLSDRDYRAGLAESVKHALIRDASFIHWHEEHVEAVLRRDPVIVRELIRRNCEIKAAVVAEDERETAERTVGRAALNLGHTAGHAIEAQSGYALRHGEAVSLGLVVALDLAVRCRGFPAADRDRAEALLLALGLPVRAREAVDAADLIRRMASDKKARHRALRFVLPSAIGQVEWMESVAHRHLEAALGRLNP